MSARRETEAIVPQITAGGNAAALQLPERIPYQDYSGLERVGGQIGRIGSDITGIGAYYNEIQKKTQILADKSESAVLNAEHTAQLNSAKQELERDPTLNDPNKFAQAFLARE